MGKLEKLPAPEIRVGPGDYLVLAVSREHEPAVRELLGTEREGRLEHNG